MTISPDNRYLASGGYQRPVQLWDIETGELILTLTGRSAYLAFSPDGKYLVSAGVDLPLDDPARIWDVGSGDLITTFPDFYSYFIPWFLISTDGNIIYPELNEGIYIRDIQTGKLISLLPMESVWSSFNFSSDEKKIILGGNPVKIWDIETNNLTTLKEGVYGAGNLLLSMDGSKLISGTNWLNVWDLKNGQILTTIDGFGEYRSATFSPEGERLAISPPTRIWDLETGMPIHDVACGYAEQLSFSPDGLLITSVCYKQDEEGQYFNFASLYNTSTCDEVLLFEGKIEGNISSPTFSPDGSLFALAYGTQWRGEGKWNIAVWDTDDGKLEFSLTHPRFYSMAFSPDGSLLVVGGSKTIRFINPQTGEIEFEEFQTSPIKELLFSPNGNLLASAGYSDIQIWNTKTLEKSISFPFGIQNLNGMDISPDGTMLASIHTPYEVRILRLWDLLTGENVYTIEGDHHNWGKVKFNQDGTLLVTTGLSTKGIQIWDVNSGDLLWTDNRSPTYYTNNKNFKLSPNGRFLAFIGRDGTIILFAACDVECPRLQKNP